MPPRKRLLPYVSPGGPVVLTGKDWHEIEKASGLQLTRDAYARVCLATMAFALHDDSSAPPKAVLTKIKNMGKKYKFVTQIFS
jgi:hypothetical protein